MSLKSSLLALANNIGMCQENARSIKQALAGGLADAGAAAMDDWKLVKTETGNTSIALPEAYNELFIYMTKSHASTTLYVPKPVVDTLEADTPNSFYGGGYATASANIQTRVKLTKASAQMDQFYYGGTSIIADASISVYYR